LEDVLLPIVLLLAQTTAGQQTPQQREQAALTRQLQLENDRLARQQAQQRLDVLNLQLRDARPAERAALQSRLQEQQRALQSIAHHEQLTELELVKEIDRLRLNLDRARAANRLSTAAIQQSQFEIRDREVALQRLRAERQSSGGQAPSPVGPSRGEAPVLLPVSGVNGLVLNEIETRRILLQEALSKVVPVRYEPRRGLVVTVTEKDLGAVATILKKQESLVMTIEAPSKTRAQAVRTALARDGVRADHIGVASTGKEGPILLVIAP
jgi:hypothetical protein